MRLIEIVADAGHTDTLASIADQHEVTDYWCGAPADDGRRSFRMLVDDQSRQPVMDALQNILGGSGNARIVVLPIEAVLPREAARRPRRPRARSCTRRSSAARVSTATTSC